MGSGRVVVKDYSNFTRLLMIGLKKLKRKKI